jgi:hypothetical protein
LFARISKAALKEKKNERRGENMDKIPEYIRLMKEDREYCK